MYRIEHLYKRYKGEGKYVLEDITFSLPSRGLVGIQGKSGCGKSTLLHLLLGMLTSSKGKIYFGDENVTMFSQSRMLKYRRFDTGIIFQHYCLMEHLTAVENIALSSQISGVSKIKARRRALELLRRFGLESLAKKKACVLSGGEKQRVAICRSIIGHPKVVFADEPTGALDSSNAKIVMETLKKISRDSLVVIVSHNSEILRDYADRILTLKDGKIVNDESFKPVQFSKAKKTRTRIHQGHWAAMFLNENLRKKKGSIFTRYLACLVGFSFGLLSIGFVLGNGPALEAKKKDTLEYFSFHLSFKEYVEIPSSPLRLVKESRPKENDAWDYLAAMEGVSLHLDYSYFLPGSLPFDYHGEKQEPCRFIPVYDATLEEYGSSLLVESSPLMIPSAIPCSVNEEFLQTYACKVGDSIHIQYSSEVVYFGQKETISTQIDFFIQNSISEFSFLNSPKVYYSYPMIDSYFGQRLLENLPLRNGRYQSVSSYLSNLDGADHQTSYDYIIYAHSLEAAERLMEIIPNQSSDGLFLQSNAYDVAVSFSSLSEALMAALSLFAIIAFFALFVIIALNAYASFLSSKRQSAILLALGAKRSDIIGLVASESTLIAGIASLSSLGLAYFLQNILSKLLEGEFGIPHLVQIPFSSLFGVPYLFIPLVVLTAIIVSLLASLIPLLIFGRIDLTEALKEE